MNKTASLNIDLSLLPEGVNEYHYMLDDAFFSELDQQTILGGNIEADVRMFVVGEEVKLTLALKGEVSVPCDRCLDPVEMPVEAEDELEIGRAHV